MATPVHAAPPTVSLNATTSPTTSTAGSAGITLNGSFNPNSISTTAYFRVWQFDPGSCTYGGQFYNGRICSNVKGTNAACGEYYATGTYATGWWHISSSCWGSSYKLVTGTVGCR